MALECNIDDRGKAYRFLGGVAAIVGGVALAGLAAANVVSHELIWVPIISALGGGAFAIFEARAGWCIVRAMGFRTPV